MMNCIVKELAPVERAHFSNLVIGKTTCPHCNRGDVKVVNDKGTHGDKYFHYLENHYPEGGIELCQGSEKLLRELSMN